MTTIQRQKMIWSGFPGGPGVSYLYFLDAAAHVFALGNWINDFRSGLPDDVTITLEPGGDIIVAETGVLSGTWVGTVTAPQQGIQVGGYAAPAGAIIRWDTNAVLFGHRVRGGTYLVPLSSNNFDVDGTLAAAGVAAKTTAAQALVDAIPNNMQVWVRPRPATPSWTDVQGRLHPALAARAGAALPVKTARCVDKSVVLRSRRD